MTAHARRITDHDLPPRPAITLRYEFVRDVGVGDGRPRVFTDHRAIHFGAEYEPVVVAHAEALAAHPQFANVRITATRQIEQMTHEFDGGTG